MGKQWLLNKLAADPGTGTGGCHGYSKSRKRPHRPMSSSSSSSSSGGCMNAIFHLFDIQNYHFPFHQPSFISNSGINITDESNTTLEGVAAPRNSLELDKPVAEEVVSSSSSSSSSKLKQETNFNIAMGGIQIKTKRSKLMDDVSSECSSSPGTKTPSVVARLMGLDLLPENSSPRPSLSSPRPSSSSSHATPSNPNKHQTKRWYTGTSPLTQNTRSLPVTPRGSTAATDVDCHHRLSLQINKENRRISEGNRGDDESRSAYAKEIVKQVRENICRRVGADITNTVTKKEQRRDQCLVVLKPKTRSSPSPSPSSKDDEISFSSPRLRLLEIKNNLKKPISNSSLSSSSPSPPPATTKENETPVSSSRVRLLEINHNLKKPTSSSLSSSKVKWTKEEVQKVQKCKRVASAKYDLRLKKQEEAFVVKKCNKKSTPLSNHLLNVNTTPKFISFKKDMASPSTTPHPQVPLKSITQLPSCQSPSYNSTKQTHKLTVQDNGVAIPTTVTGGTVSGYCEYVSRILSHSGIVETTPISITHWYSPSHPLHPWIFHHLEKLRQPIDATDFPTRKLIFEVVDELLVEILKPYLSFKPWASGRRRWHRMQGWELIGELCEKIKRFPAADCRVMEDIDGLIEGDMRGSTRVVGPVAFEEEAEEVVREMERDMVDTLVGEVAGIICHVGWGRQGLSGHMVSSRDEMPFVKGCT